MEPSEITPPEPPQEFVSSRARRRRAMRRAYFPANEEERAALFDHLARRAFPSYELFIFAIVAGAIMGLGYFLDSQSLLIFGVLVAPLLTSWIGMSLGIIAGAGRLFLQTLLALLVSAALTALGGVLAGYATRIFPQPRTFNEAFLHSRLWIPDFFVLAIGAVLITLSFVRSEQRPYLPSALVAYELFLPLCAAGLGLGSGIEGLALPGLLVFLIHFAWATLFCILTLFFLRFYPLTFSGISLTGIVLVALLAWLTIATGALQWIRIQTGLATPQPDSANQATATLPLVPTLTPTFNPTLPPQAVTAATLTPAATSASASTATPSPRPTATPSPSQTPTFTITAEPTPIIAFIRAPEGGGANIRERPNGLVLLTLSNGSTVTIIPNDIQEVNNVVWVHVFALVNGERVEGWVLQSLLVTATPPPNWQPSATPPATSTP
ncbi:MAG: DUF389 domain-containing protein [Chloroflexota bacterium]|nr:DUF389 domain-containing protein [Chloroflexota bacterium]MBI5704937.1 DUF389 domain-containing protein [Chloroflexota bacterium]